ncbi:MAG: response regulator [Bdellovibrionales bacterium]|nr:response regulator [Bdellovibrionales bacterium]
MVTVVVLFTIFRTCQYYLNTTEASELNAIHWLQEQRDRVAELERLLAFAQSTPGAVPAGLETQLQSTYTDLRKSHGDIKAVHTALSELCAEFPCAGLQTPEIFTNGGKLPPLETIEQTQAVLSSALAYHADLKDAIERAVAELRETNLAGANFDTIAYLSLLLLLVLQALFIFGPAIRKLNASLSTRSDFLSRISHEIRNPMNSIIGMADILKGTKLNYEQQQYVDNLLRSGQALLDMLNNLIDFSSIESRKLTLNPQPFDLFKSLERCLSLISIQAHHKNLNVYVSLSPKISQRLEGDSVRLEQVLINLLKNAAKFTEQGSITLNVEVEAETEGSVQLLFSVEDTGIGIRQDQLGEIFESFVQGDSSIQRKYGGSGLGLSISSELIRLMGGQLNVHSDLGKGSTFFFSVRLNKQAPRPDVIAKPLTPLIGQKFAFLTAPPEKAVYTELFEKLQAPTAVLATAQELRHALEQSSGGISEILIDDSVGIISMINCRNAADQHGLGDRSVALIRSNFTKENMDLLRRNGFMRFLIKPLKPWDLLSLPAQLSEEQNAAGARPLINKLKEKNLRMLLVDDSNDNLFLLKEVVQPLASTIHFAENGLDAIEKFRQHPYDVVFMDIQMPVMDGYTAIRKMREMEAGAQGQTVPIYAVTAHAGLVDAQKCREAGFTDRIVKPVVRTDIYQSLSKAFALDVTADFDEGDTGSAVPSKYLDKLIPTYLRTRFEDMVKLRAALASCDFNTISALGHKIKGSAASYGFPRVSERAKQLEHAAQSANLERCQTIADELDQMFHEEQRRRN